MAGKQLMQQPVKDQPTTVVPPASEQKAQQLGAPGVKKRGDGGRGQRRAMFALHREAGQHGPREDGSLRRKGGQSSGAEGQEALWGR